MEKRLIARGLLAGLVGAVMAFVFARLCAEPIIARAIAYEDGRTEAEQAPGVHEHGVELFTRGVQANAGLGFGVLLFGLAMGALFAVLFCLRSREPTTLRRRGFQALLAAAAFVAVYLVPFVSSLATAGRRPVGNDRDAHRMVSGSRAGVGGVGVAAGSLARRLTTRLGAWNAGVVATDANVACSVLVVCVAAECGDPPVDVAQPLRDVAGVIIYPGFSADVLYQFRLVSLGTQLVLWATIGLAFGRLSARLLGQRASSLSA